MSSAWRVSCLAVLTCLVAGCVSAREVGSDPFSGGRSAFDREGVRLTVENQNLRDATVYAYWNGSKDRVGMVIAKTTKTFDMRWRSEEIQLEVDFVGGGGHWSEPMPVFDGDHLNYIIRPGRR